MTDRDEQARWHAFTLLFAAAACLHLLGNSTFPDSSGVVLVGAGALAVVLRPASRSTMALLAAAALILAWQESPDLSNHWLLASLVGLASLTSRRLPAVRSCYLVFYGFAAFAKLNSSFFDESVTCAAPYLRDVTDAVGLGGLDLTRHASVRFAAAIATAVAELSVPLLLVRRATRTVGVLVAIGFHLVVALPDEHQFYDFSSVLLAGWVTFLPAEPLRRVAATVSGRVTPSTLQAVGALLVVLSTIVAAGGSSGRWSRAATIDVGWILWQPLSFAALGVVMWWCLRDRRGADVPLRPHAGAAALVPLLVVVNGVLPYLEVKTGAGWNMYANLRTVDGRTNHLLVPRTFPIASPQDDLVEVVESSDPQLDVYRDVGFLLPLRSARAYLQQHDDVWAVLRVGNEFVTIEPGAALPERLGPPVPTIVEHLFVLRAVDSSSPERCQTGILPAR